MSKRSDQQARDKRSDYVFEREVSRHALGAVWLGRRTRGGGGVAGLLIKQVRPYPLVYVPPDLLKHRALRLIEQAKAARQIGRRSPHWLTVHGWGEEPGGGGAFVVVDHCPLSVQRLIDAKVRLTGSELHQIVRGILQGLLDLKKGFSRTHGNLKPTNVLLKGGGAAGLVAGEVLLSDPAPAAEMRAATPAEAEAADLRAVGKMIGSLIAGAPKNGEGRRWAALRDRLLTAGIDPAKRLTVEQALAALPRRPITVGPRAAVSLVALLLLLGIGAALVFGFGTNEQDRFRQADWEQLCRAYGGWFGELANTSEDRFKELTQDQDLKYALAPLAEARRRGWTDSWRAAFPDPAAQPRGDLRTAPRPTAAALLPAGVRQMRAALNVASAVEGNLRRWTFFTEASRLSHEYDDCAAGSYLAGLHRAMDGAMRGDGADYQRSALIPAVQSLLKARLLLGPLSSLSKSRRQIVNLRQDKLLQRFGELVCAAADELADDLRSNDTAEQAAGETLAAVAEAADHVLNELKGNVDWNAMQAMPVMQNATGGDVNLARLKAWVDAAKACGRDDYDPWAKSETAERRQSVVREITSSVARLRELGAEEKDDSLLREAEELNSRAKSEVERPSKIPPLLGRRAARDLAVSDALRDLSVVRFAASEEVLNRSKTLLADLTRLSGVTASGSQTLDEQWLRRRNAIVELVAQRQMDGVGAARALNALRTRLIELDSDKRLAPSVQASLNDRRPWNAAAVKLITADVRDDAIRTALPIVTPRRIANDALEGLPGRDEPKWNQAADRYAQLREEAASLVRDFNLMLDALEALMSPDDPLTAPAGKSSLRTLYAQWQERLKQPDELLRRPELAGAIAVANRASRLLAVSALDPDVPAQRDELQHVLLSGKSDPELTVAAWRRLPLLPAEDEARARAKVLGAIATVPSAERQAALKTMIAERALDRWLAAWLVATADAAKVNQEPQKVDALAARVAEFESDPRRLLRDRKLDERAKYDLLLAQLRNTARSGKLDESGDGRGALNELKRDVQTFCPSLEKEPALAALLARATQQASSSADLSKSGPGSVQWRRVPTEGDADGRRIAFAPPEGSPLRLNLKSLVFERVEPPTEAPMKDAARPFYLCTTAVPVDLFLSAVNDHLSEFTPLFPDVGSGDSRAGPRSWEWVGKQARLTRFWLAAVPTRQQDYPDTLRGTRGGRSLKDEVGGDPSYDHPIQYVTPEAAVYFAALLGSRLPTPEEWLAAHQMELQRAKANGAAVTWNLRDQTWEAQRKYAEQLVQNRLDPAWPDAGIFVPEKTKRSGRDAEAVQPGVDDQRLWFDKVNGDAGRTFHHLVGNVATFALADRENTDQLLRRGNVRPQDARDLLQQPGVLSVIGASALSPPEIDWNDPRPQPLNVRYAQNHGGYADVGIRLAFSAPTDTLATYVLQNARYLPTR